MKKKKKKEELIIYEDFYNTIKKEKKYIFNIIYTSFLLENNIDFIKHFLRYQKNIELLYILIKKFKEINKEDNIYNNYSYFIFFIKDQTCKPFWNEKIKNISKKIFLPIEENIREIEKNKTFLAKTWFKTNHFISKKNENKIEMIKERKITNGIKTKKIKLLLTSIQKTVFKKITGIYRYFYNRSIEYINNYNKHIKESFYTFEKKQYKISLKDEKNPFSMFTMRKYLKDNIPSFVNFNINQHIIDLAFKEASNNYKKAILKYQKTKNVFCLKYKKKKDIYQTFYIEKCMFNKRKTTLFPSLLFNGENIGKKMKFSESFKLLDICDSTITYHKYLNDFTLNLNYISNKKEILENKKKYIEKQNTYLKKINYIEKKSFYINLLKEIKNKKKINKRDKKKINNCRSKICKINIRIEKKTVETKINNNEKKLLKINNELENDVTKTNKVCSIDPGIRCFLTVYSDEKIDMIGINCIEKINKICKEMDIIISKINSKNEKINNKNKKMNRRSIKNNRKALHRKIKYLKNIKEELHNKSIKYLTDNYSKIILPPFETQKMSMIFNSKISRNLYNISYYTFLLKLKNKCIENDINLVIKPEYYTSKTCTSCGNLKKDLGSNKVYNCNICGLKIDRDINGARNILLRNHDWEIPPFV